MKLFSFFQRRRAPIRVAPVMREANSISLQEWRTNDSLIVEAQRLFQSNTFLAMVQVLKNESPLNYAVTETAERALGKIEGYQLCLNNLEAFPIPVVPQQHVESTFEPAEE